MNVDPLSRARTISWWALLLMVFIVPLAMTDFTFPGLTGRVAFSSVELIKLSLIRILALIALGAWTWDLLRKGGSMRRTPVDWLILGWVGWVGLTTIVSLHWPTALLGAHGRYEGLLTFITYALVYFLVLQFAHDGPRVLRLAQVLFWSSVVVAIYGVLQYAGVVLLPEELPWDETNRAFSTFGNPNVLGGYLIFAVVVALGLVLREQRLAWRLVYWTGFGLNGLALLVTFTRGAWIGGLVGLILVGLMAWRRRTRMKKIDWIPAGLFGLAGIAVIVRSLFSSGEVTNFARRIASIFQFSSGSGQTRAEIWQAALSSIKDRPLFGWGSDTFGQVFSRFKPAEYVRDAGGSSGADNAHDYPLHLASGIGILGALLFFAIWIWAGVRSWKTVFGRSDDPAQTDATLDRSTRLLRGSFWAASAGYLLHLVFSISVPGSTFLLWMALALVLAPTAHRVALRPRRGGTVIASTILFVAALCIAGQGVVLAADRQYETASEDFSLRQPSERADAAERAVDLNSLASEHRSTLGAVRSEQMRAAMRSLAQAREEGRATGPYAVTLRAGFADAEAAYRDAIDFTPWDYANYVNLASLYNSAAGTLDDSLYRDAIDTADQGLEVMPYGTAIRVQLAHALLATGQTAKARETLEYCLELDPRDGNAALALTEIYAKEGRESEALALLISVEAAAPGQRGVAAAIKALESGQPLP